MPFGMNLCVQSVLMGGTLYVGGGAGDDEDHDYVVMTYDISEGKWGPMLPSYSTHYFAMTAIDNHLVLVGGEGYDGARSKALGVWSEDSKRWMCLYPDMTTARSSCSAVTYEEWLIVAGGTGDDDEPLFSVEILDTVTEQWRAGPPTPIAWEDMKTAIVGDVCYFMGGWAEHEEISVTSSAYSVSLPALIDFQHYCDAQTWNKLPQLPVEAATPLSINGSLLAVGGRTRDKAVSALHLYQPDAGQWVEVADMPTPRYACTCIMTNARELLVAGGTGCHDIRIEETDIVQIKDHTF